MGLVNVTLVPGQLESGAQCHAVSTLWVADTNQNGILTGMIRTHQCRDHEFWSW